MNDISVLILASGIQDRFGQGELLKQLLWAGRETIIARIIRQVRERGLEPTIVTHRFQLHFDGVQHVEPVKRRWKVESLLAVDDYWGKKRTFVLLGDVVYQGHVLNRILDCKARDMFFGNYAEIFAYMFSYNKLAREMMVKAQRQCEINDDKGTLHTLFRAYIDGFLFGDVEFHKDHSDVFTHVTGDGGWTRDIDSKEDYERFIEEVIKTNKLDDLPGE